MKLIELMNLIEEKFPKEIAEDFDNVGLLVGDFEKEIKKVLVCLDVNSESIDYAVSKNSDLIISHHPVIFKSLKSVTMEDITARKIIKLIRENIAAYALHTNLDSAKDGLNDYVWSLLDLDSTRIYEKETNNRPIRCYELKDEIKIEDMIEILKVSLGLKKIRLVHNNYYTSNRIKKIALVTGSGMSFKDEIYDKVDLFITSDIKYHEALDSLEQALPLIDIGHYESEIFSVDLIKDFLTDNTDLLIDTFYSGPILKTV